MLFCALPYFQYGACISLKPELYINIIPKQNHEIIKMIAIYVLPLVENTFWHKLVHYSEGTDVPFIGFSFLEVNRNRDYGETNANKII